MSIRKEAFGKTKDGRSVTAYILDNGTVRVRVLDLGANLADLIVPDRNGRKRDVLLGWDDGEGYGENKDFFGSVIGPSANRIAGASYMIGDRKFRLPVNDGENNLHTDFEHGFHKRIWEAKTGDNEVTFRLHLADGELGFPGNRDFEVTYTLTADNGVKIHYHGESDADTLINPTNHAYFNLDGHDAGSILDTCVQLHCSAFTPVVKGAIPTGEIRKVDGTVFDFRKPKKIGTDIFAEEEQLKLVNGYDHNYVIDGYRADGTLLPAAKVWSEKSGIVMEVETTLPGVQFYTGNFVDDKGGKDGVDYSARSGFCLETQFYPDTVHHPQFPSCIFKAGEAYDSTTVYRFSAE